MSLQISSIRIIGGSGHTVAVASKAAERAFPNATVARDQDVENAAQQELPTGAELLVLVAPDRADLNRAESALDARGLPRWAIVARSPITIGHDSHLINVSPDDWNEPLLVLAFASAVRMQALKSANIQLCGDLRTIGRRLAHDLRSPLNCITTASEAMKDPAEKADSPRTRFAQSISSSVDEVVRMVDRISFILTATTNPPPRQPVVMEEIIWGTLQSLESRMLAAGVGISKPQKWPIVEGVPAWFAVIWSNLLSNSLEHAGPKPQIEIGWEQLPGEYRFWLRDQGKGVPPKQENRLFYPLDRLSDLNAPRGFGLSIVHRLVELQGGRCGHRREAGNGGMFYFTLPFSDHFSGSERVAEPKRA